MKLDVTSLAAAILTNLDAQSALVTIRPLKITKDIMDAVMQAAADVVAAVEKEEQP